ncbi:MAG: Fic family protein [Odoribacter sp.]|nr:Fic family protein [Odoribacter sp.]
MKTGIIHPLIIIGTFIYEFLSIHSFQDGNGRLAC